MKRILEQVDRHIVLSELDKHCMQSLVPKNRVYYLPGGVSFFIHRAVRQWSPD